MRKAQVCCSDCGKNVGCVLINFFKECSKCWLQGQCPFKSPIYFKTDPIVKNVICTDCLRSCLTCTDCCFE